MSYICRFLQCFNPESELTNGERNYEMEKIIYLRKNKTCALVLFITQKLLKELLYGVLR